MQPEDTINNREKSSSLFHQHSVVLKPISFLYLVFLVIGSVLFSLSLSLFHSSRFFSRNYVDARNAHILLWLLFSSSFPNLSFSLLSRARPLFFFFFYSYKTDENPI